MFVDMYVIWLLKEVWTHVKDTLVELFMVERGKSAWIVL